MDEPQKIAFKMIVDVDLIDPIAVKAEYLRRAPALIDTDGNPVIDDHLTDEFAAFDLLKETMNEAFADLPGLSARCRGGHFEIGQS